MLWIYTKIVSKIYIFRITKIVKETVRAFVLFNLYIYKYAISVFFLPTGPCKARVAERHLGAAGRPCSHFKSFAPRDASSRVPEEGGSPEVTRSRFLLLFSWGISPDYECKFGFAFIYLY